MKCTANIQLQLGPQLHPTQYGWSQENLELTIPEKCPYCRRKTDAISTWGSYPTSTGEVRQYRCKTC